MKTFIMNLSHKQKKQKKGYLTLSF